MVKIILVRHAESEMNKLDIHQGQIHDSNLSKKGIEQAKELSIYLKNKNIIKIYASDLKRTLETAQIISRELGNVKIIEDKRLREFTMGDFDKNYKDRDALFKKYYEEEFSKGKSKYDIRPPNGENIWDFIKRINSFIDEVKDLTGNILVVSHGGTNEVFLNLAQNLEKNSFKRYHQDNSCLNELIYNNDKWEILSINETPHLRIIKPKKEIYPCQEDIKRQILKKIIPILIENGISDAFLFGSLLNGDFGKYDEIFGRHKGSNVNILTFIKNKNIPKEWKYIGKFNSLKIYEISKYTKDDIKHKIDLFIAEDDADRISIDKLGNRERIDLCCH